MKTSILHLLGGALAAFSLTLTPNSQAAAATFVGFTSVNWNVAGNWLSGSVPAVGDDLVIADLTTNNLTMNDSAHTVGMLQFGAAGLRANPGSPQFILNGNVTGAGAYALTITNGLVANGNFNVGGTAGFQTKVPIIMQGDQTWSVGGAPGNSVTDEGVMLTVGAGGAQRPLVLNGTLTKVGAGQLGFVGQLVTNGSIVVNQGALKFNAGTSTTLSVGGPGTITVNNGGSLFISRNSGTLNITKAIVLNNGAALRLGGNAATANFVGSPFAFNGTVPITLEYASMLLDFTNNWSGTANSTFSGSGGTITFWGNNSGLAGTLNNSGTFHIRFGSATSGSAGATWALNNAAAYFDLYGPATNIQFGALSGAAGSVRGWNTNGLAATATVGALNTSTTFGGTLVDNTAPLALVKVGTGTLTLGGASTFSGGTTISNGAVMVLGTTASLGTGPVTVETGAAFGGNGSAGGTVTMLPGSVLEADGGVGANPLTLGGLTFGAGSTDLTTTRINVYLGGIIAGGTVSVNGTNVINIIGAAPAVGVYDLIRHTGAIGGAGFPGFVLGALPYGVVATLQDSGAAVQLNISAVTVETSIWVGSIAGAWSLDNSFEWKGAISGNPQAYHDLYPAFFDDSATNFTVNLTTNLTPAVTFVNNTAHNYLFAGVGGLVGGGALTKDGPGTLTLACSNNFTGGTFITNGVVQIGNGGTNGVLSGPVVDNGALVLARSDVGTLSGVVSGSGTVQQIGPGSFMLSGANTYLGQTTVSAGTLVAGNGSALGDTNGITTVADGATLDVASQNLGMEPITVRGAGVGGAGAIVNFGTGDQQQALRFVTLAGPTTFGGAYRWDIRDPVSANDPTGGGNAFLAGNGNSLTKVSSNIVAFINVGDTALGDINIQGGTLTFSRGTFLGNPAKTLTVYPGATFQLHRTAEYTSNIPTKVLVMTNAIIAVESNGLTNQFGGPVTLTASNTVSLPSATGLNFLNTVGGSGSFTANSAGLLVFSGTANYTGGTTVNGGVLEVDGSLGTGATPLVLANTLVCGNGVIRDPVTVPAGCTLAPGVGGIGQLSFGASLTLSAGANSIFELNKDSATNDFIQVSGPVAYGGTLLLTNLASTGLAPGDVYKLFNASAYSGSFSTIIPATPSLGLIWVTNFLTVDGTLRVAVLPIPNPPVVLSADSLSSNSVTVVFNMTVDAASATDPSHYSLSTTNAVISATQVTSTNILLGLDSALVVTNFTVHVQGVKNLSYVPDTIVATNVPAMGYGFQETVAIDTATAYQPPFASLGKIKVYASGADIFNAADAFEFVYIQVTNDFDFSVCLESFQETDVAAKAGLMVREILDPVTVGDNERNFMVESFPPDPGRAQNLIQWREDTGATAIALATPRPASTVPTNWVRLTRVGSVFSGYTSPNNLDWTYIGSVDSATNALGAYGPGVRVGLAATAHNAALVTEAVFSGFGVPKPHMYLSVTNLSGGATLVSWPLAGVGLHLQATPSLTPPSVWTNVPGSTATNYIVVPSGAGASYYRLTQ